MWPDLPDHATASLQIKNVSRSILYLNFPRARSLYSKYLMNDSEHSMKNFQNQGRADIEIDIRLKVQVRVFKNWTRI